MNIWLDELSEQDLIALAVWCVAMWYQIQTISVHGVRYVDKHDDCYAILPQMLEVLPTSSFLINLGNRNCDSQKYELLSSQAMWRDTQPLNVKEFPRALALARLHWFDEIPHTSKEIEI